MRKPVPDPEFQIIGDPVVSNTYWLLRLVDGRILDRKYIPKGFDVYLAKDAPRMGLKKGFNIRLPQSAGAKA